MLDAARKGCVTLVFGAWDEKQNHAIALKSYLEKRLKRNDEMQQQVEIAVYFNK